MKRNDKLVKLIFNEILGSQNRNNPILNFMSIDRDMSITTTEDMKKYKALYSTIINKIYDNIKELANLEEIITQLRCKELVSQEIKFIKVRHYIYARSIFYQSNKKPKDIRILIDDMYDYNGLSYEEIIQKPEFIELAKEKLKNAMNANINLTKILIDKIEKKYDFILVNK